MKIQPIALFILSASVSGLAMAYEYEKQDDDDSRGYKHYSSNEASTSHRYSSHAQSSSYKHDGYDDYHDDTDDEEHEYESGHEYKRKVLNLVGTGYMYEQDVPDIDGDKNPDPAMCFDVDLQDPTTGESIGYATDCLSEITGEGDGVKLIGTTYFYLSDGVIVTRGLTTVQPVLQETVTPNGNTITHITGASSDKNGVLKAYGDYAWHQGPVRLSGMVDLSQFSQSVGDPIHFDCLFTLKLKEVKYHWPHWYNWHRHHHYQDDRYDRNPQHSHNRKYRHEHWSDKDKHNDDQSGY